MTPETLFLFGLLLKMMLTATIVVLASFVVERSGPFIGALIASLPTAAGAAYIILAIEHPPSFIAASAVGSMASNVVGGLFAMSYAVLAQRLGALPSIAGAVLVWFAGAALLGFVQWDAASALALNLVFFSATAWFSRRFRTEGAKGAVKPTAREVAWRAAVVAIVVVTVTALSHRIGSWASGMFALFPVAMGSFFVILHSRVGGPASASVAAHLQAPLIGLGLNYFTVHLLAEAIGVWWSLAAGLAVGLVWNALLWLLRQRRLKAG